MRLNLLVKYQSDRRFSSLRLCSTPVRQSSKPFCQGSFREESRRTGIILKLKPHLHKGFLSFLSILFGVADYFLHWLLPFYRSPGAILFRCASNFTQPSADVPRSTRSHPGSFWMSRCRGYPDTMLVF